MKSLADCKECRVPATNVQSYVREMMLAKKGYCGMLSVHREGREMHGYTGVARCAGNGYKELKGLMTNQIIYIFEFKRTSDREHGYVQRCNERATEQHSMQV